MRYDSIIWDFDGTLFDTYPAMCRDLRRTMEGLGFSFTEAELLERRMRQRLQLDGEEMTPDA